MNFCHHFVESAQEADKNRFHVDNRPVCYGQYKLHVLAQARALYGVLG